MITNILTCVGTGTLGVGVGLVINTFRRRKRSHQETQSTSTDAVANKPTTPTPKNLSNKRKLRIAYGLQSYFDSIQKFISKETKEEIHAFHSIGRYIDRILELNEMSSKHAEKKRRYWNPAGAISANVTKVKLWLKTLDHLFKERLGNKLPEELIESLQYINEYTMAEQYNKLLDN